MSFAGTKDGDLIVVNSVTTKTEVNQSIRSETIEKPSCNLKN